MNIQAYVVISALIIMLWYFIMNTRVDSFGLFQMIGLFVFGGCIGWYMDSLLLGILFSVGLALWL